MDSNNEILVELVRFIFAILAPIAAGALTWAAVQLARKLGFEVSAQHQAKLHYFAQQAIHEAEEWAAHRVKVLNLPAPGARQKLEHAIGSLIDQVPGVTRQEADQIIHAVLPQVRGVALEVVSDIRQAATNEAR